MVTASTTKAAHKKDLRSGYAEMQHRHFATIAKIIREFNDGSYAKDQIADIFATMLPHTNPNFNKERFMAACLVDSEEASALAEA